MKTDYGFEKNLNQFYDTFVDIKVQPFLFMDIEKISNPILLGK